MATYSLRIKGFTPQTFPLGRLGEYVCALAELIGDDIQASFERVTKGSAQLKIAIDPLDEAIVVARIRLAPSADESSTVRRGYEKIQSLLSADKTSAEFKPEKGAAILKFPGSPKGELKLSIVKEYGELSGRIIKVGGRDDTIPVAVRTPDGEVVNCSSTLEMARRLKSYLLEPVDVILVGVGRWKRLDSGAWATLEFKISDFSVMDFGGLDAALDAARASGSGWDAVQDVNEELSRIRYGA